MIPSHKNHRSVVRQILIKLSIMRDIWNPGNSWFWNLICTWVAKYELTMRGEFVQFSAWSSPYNQFCRLRSHGIRSILPVIAVTTFPQEKWLFLIMNTLPYTSIPDTELNVTAYDQNVVEGNDYLKNKIYFLFNNENIIIGDTTSFKSSNKLKIHWWIWSHIQGVLR